jgi:hypothetical protein
MSTMNFVFILKTLLFSNVSAVGSYHFMTILGNKVLFFYQDRREIGDDLGGNMTLRGWLLLCPELTDPILLIFNTPLMVPNMCKSPTKPWFLDLWF